MALTLEQYGAWLDGRGLPWPAPPPIDTPRAKPHLERMPKVRAVLWTVYGTLLSIPPHGELLFQHPQDFVQEMALEKTIAEFKMWGSMTRKPGQPHNYMNKVFQDLLDLQRLAPGVPGEHHPEILADRIWDGVVKRLMQKDYHFDTGFYGALNLFAQKIAFFYHSSLQATTCYHNADVALVDVSSGGMIQGLLADAQCFTCTQLQRGLNALGCMSSLDMLLPVQYRFLSYDVHGRKPSKRLLSRAIEKLAERGIQPSEILHVGSNIERDIAPAKKMGMKTALFAGDKASLVATPEHCKNPATKPDLMLTDLAQIGEVVG
jgi:histidinol phosphatase-like enzyme